MRKTQYALIPLVLSVCASVIGRHYAWARRNAIDNL